MNLHDIQVTGTQCKNRMKSLIQTFNKAYDTQRGTGAGAPEFEYYNEFLNIFKGSPCLEAPVCASVGRGLTMTIEGKKVEEAPSHSRTRQKAEKKKTYNYKSAVTMQARAPAPQDQLAVEVKRMTDIYDEKSNAKLALFKQLVDSSKLKR